MLMKHHLLLLLLAFVLSLPLAAQTTASAADNAAAFIGKWAGTYDGAASGKCEMNILRKADGQYEGSIVVIPVDESRYTIQFKTLIIEGNKLKASYNEPGENTPISLEGTLSGDTLKGTYQTNNGEATGTWTMAHQNK